MTDTEILFWLVNNGAIDRAVLVYAKIAGNGETVATIRDKPDQPRGARGVSQTTRLKFVRIRPAFAAYRLVTLFQVSQCHPNRKSQHSAHRAVRSGS